MVKPGTSKGVEIIQLKGTLRQHSETSDYEVALQWEQGGNYDLTIARANVAPGDLEYTDLSTVRADQKRYVDKTVSVGQSYQYIAFAFDGDRSNWDKVLASAFKVDIPTPAVPHRPPHEFGAIDLKSQIDIGKDPNDFKVRLTWTPRGNFPIILWRTLFPYNTMKPVVIERPLSGQGKFTDYSARPGNSYRYQVESFDGKDHSVRGNPTDVTMPNEDLVVDSRMDKCLGLFNHYRLWLKKGARLRFLGKMDWTHLVADHLYVPGHSIPIYTMGSGVQIIADELIITGSLKIELRDPEVELPGARKGIFAVGKRGTSADLIKITANSAVGTININNSGLPGEPGSPGARFGNGKEGGYGGDAGAVFVHVKNPKIPFVVKATTKGGKGGKGGPPGPAGTKHGRDGKDGADKPFCFISGTYVSKGCADPYWEKTLATKGWVPQWARDKIILGTD